ncbi:hypothetical protein EIP86_010310 [Pleurotus ostreatoroseus]|nr:hypothetical protein EIP86_010310 [Pleurotus ostreatoroseus]
MNAWYIFLGNYTVKEHREDEGGSVEVAQTALEQECMKLPDTQPILANIHNAIKAIDDKARALCEKHNLDAAKVWFSDAPHLHQLSPGNLFGSAALTIYENIVFYWMAMYMNFKCMSLKDAMTEAIKDEALSSKGPLLATVEELHGKAKAKSQSKSKSKTSHEKANLPRVFDYTTNKWVQMTSNIALDARENPTLWLGTIEHGQDTALQVLNNRNGHAKCLTCHFGGRGKSQPARGQPMRQLIQMDGVISCGCLKEGALMEYFIAKMEGTAPSDFNLSPTALVMISETIAQVSGLEVSNMFTTPINRHLITLNWAIEKLDTEMPSDDAQTIIKDIKGLIAELEKSNAVATGSK